VNRPPPDRIGRPGSPSAGPNLATFNHRGSEMTEPTGAQTTESTAQTTESAAQATESASPKAGRREWVGLSVLSLACLLYVMDLTVLHLAVPAISADLRPSSVQLLWIIDIYGFMVAGFLVTMGTLGDRIGRRKVLMAGAVVFGIFSVMAAFSTSPEMLIASRALLGLAGATLAPSTLSLIFSMFQDPKQRSVAISVWISAFSAGSAIGPVLGGILLEHFWWGSVFLLAVPVMAALLVLGPIVLPEYRDENARRIDLISAALSILAVLGVIFGLKQIAQDGFDVLPAASIVAGLVLGALWVRRQLTVPDPMIDLRLFRLPAFSGSLVINFVTVFVAVGYFLYIAQYLQLVLGLSPLEAGLWSLPSAITFIVGSQLAPRIVRRLRPAYVIAAGLVFAAVGLAMLTQAGASGGLGILVAASVIISLGFGPVITLTTELIVGSAPPEQAGAASGISETSGELGGALGIAILGTIGVAIYRARLADQLPSSVPADAAAIARDTLGAAVTVANQLPQSLGQEVLNVSREAFVSGMHLTAGIAAVVAVAIAILAVVLFRDRVSGTSEAYAGAEQRAQPAAGASRLEAAEG
jgi:MFS transporter, DHA2 family, multidrug resistance protein